MTLKKPTDFFSDGETENNTINEDVSNIDELIKKPELKSFSESFDVYKSNLEKFQNFSQTIESIESIKKEFQDFLTKEDLDNAMVAYSFLLEESISKVKNDFVEIEIPKKYNKITVESELRALKHYQKFKEELDVLIEDVKQNKIFLDDTFSNFEEKIDNIKEDKIYQLDKIYNVNKLEEENSNLFDKIKCIDDIVSNLEEKINDIKEDKFYEIDRTNNVDKLEEENYRLSNKINSIDVTVSKLGKKFENIAEIKEDKIKSISDIVSNLEERIDEIKENKIYDIDKLEERNYKLSNKIKSIDNTFSNLEEKIKDIKKDKIYQVDKIEEENYKLSKKIKYIEGVFEKFNEKNILNESIITEPPNSSNSDPLTPLDKNYVTFKELENHYRLFVNRIQQQLSTFGGGGETQLKYLDDIVGIATNAGAFDGKFLKYNHSIRKFEFVTVSGGGGGGSSGIEVLNSGSSVGTGITSINFSTNVTATASGGIATITASGGGGGGDGISGITVREEGSVVGTSNSVRDINFVSDNLTASASGIGATVTLSDTPTFTSTVIGSGVTINSSGINVTGVVTATSFDGSLSSSDLDNSSVSYGGVTLALGGSDATPAFNLSDATAYPYTSLTGITTEIVGDTTPQLGGNLDLNSNNVTGTGNFNVTGIVTATSFGGSGSALTGLTGASAATYGDASNVAQIVVDANGRITGISEVTISGGGGGGSPGGSDGQIQYNNGGAFGGATQLFYDDSNNRVGINSATPTEALDVIGSVKATDFNTTSDKNLKDNIKTIENPLSKVLSIRGVNFEWKDSNKASAGVIAQEVEKVLPELVTGQNTKTVNYNGLIGLLIETVKEQQKQIDTLNEKISKLE